jgi:hypothetical protein
LAADSLGVTLQDTPYVWIALRETEHFPPLGSVGGKPGDWEFWLYRPGTFGNERSDTILGNYTIIVEQADLPGGTLWPHEIPAQSWKARRTDQASGNYYMSFDVDDGYPYAGRKPMSELGGDVAWEVRITLVNQGYDSLSLEYKDWAGNLRSVPVSKGPSLGPANEWVTYSWIVTDAHFDNNMPGATDFRINCNDDGDEIIHMLVVKGFQGSEVPTLTPTPTAFPTYTPVTPTSIPTGTTEPTPTTEGTPVPARWIQSDEVETAVVADGVLDEWPTSGGLFLNIASADTYNGLILGDADLSAELHSQWDQDYLYFAVRVNDNALVVDSGDSTWHDDAVEIGLDGLGDDVGWQPDDHRYTVRVDGTLGDMGTIQGSTNVITALQAVPAGYCLEMAIPWENLGDVPVGGGRVMGFNLALSDDDDGGGYDARLVWESDSTFPGTEGFGRIELVGDTTPTPTATRTATPTWTPTHTPTTEVTPSSTPDPLATATATPVPGRGTESEWTDSAPAIDGVLVDWPAGEALVLDTTSADLYNGVVAGTDDLSAELLSQWDYDNLYLAIRVRDDVLWVDSGESPWHDDTVEVGLDGLYDYVGWQADDERYSIRVDGTIGSIHDNPTVVAVVQGVVGGYDVEMAIPWSSLGDLGVHSGRKIGFNLGVSDDDDGGGYDARLVWEGDSTFSGSVDFGYLELVGNAGPTPTPTSTASTTPSPTMSPTATTTPSPTPTFTSTPTPTATYTPSPTPTFTATPTPTRTFTPSPTPTNTLTPTATFTATPTSTSTPIVPRGIASQGAQQMPRIDGWLPEWPTTGALVLDVSSADKYNGVVDGAEDLSARVFSQWDYDYLYLAVRVKDSLLIADSGTSLWHDDGVELGLDGLNDYVGWQPDDHRYTVRIDGTLGDMGTIVEATNAITALRELATGYQIEMAIPWGELGDVPVEAGRTVGFNVGLSDDDDGGGYDARLVWEGDSTFSGSIDFGYLELVGQPAPTPTPTALPSPTFTPGPAPTNTISPPRGFLSKRASRPFYIDGWTGEYPTPVVLVLDTSSADTYNGTIDGEADLSAELSSCWDDRNLYLAVRVHDDILVSDSDASLWHDDTVEIGLDGLHDYVGWQADDERYSVRVDGTIDSIRDNPPVEATAREMAYGYNVEMAIPWESLGDVPVEAGRTIGFNLGLSDDDDGGRYEARLVWEGDGTFSGSTDFGYIELEPGPTPTPTITPTPSPTPPSISLSVGWNLVSLPVHPADTSAAAVLEAIAGRYDLVYAYVASDVDDPWKRFDPSVPIFANDLVFIDETVGLLVHATDDVVWWTPGPRVPGVTIPLETGWNLVGYPWEDAQPVAEALESIAGELVLAYTYDGSDPLDPWKTYDPTVAPAPAGLTEMGPGIGYWINVSEPCEWSFAGGGAP